jgi:hypothetical protein
MKCLGCGKEHALKVDCYLAARTSYRAGDTIKLQGVCDCVAFDVLQAFERVALDDTAYLGARWARQCGTKSYLDTPQARAVLRGEGIDVTRRENYHLDPEKRREWTNKEKRPES